MPSTIRIVIGLACLLVAGTRDASACMCHVMPACAAFWRADAVFVGQVTGREIRQIEGQPTEILTTLTVLRTFRGEQRPSMVLRGSMNSCSYSFRTGETYLVYASRGVDGRLTGTECSGTKPVAEADEDIAMIQTLPSRSPLGWIYGTVNRAVRDPETRGVTSGRAVGVPVTLTAPGTRAMTLTDQEGRFEFVGLAPGTYTVQPTVPAPMRAHGAEVAVKARSCSPVYLHMLSTARVSGRLYLADGPPPRMVPIELRDADVTAGAPEHLIRRTIFSDREGRFTFDQVEPGRYYLGMNTPDPPTADRPYAPHFYPNAGAPTEAYVIEVGDGEQKTGFDFTLLPLSEDEIGAVTLRSPSTESAPADARPLSSPELFPRRHPFRITFPLPVRGGLDQR